MFGVFVCFVLCFCFCYSFLFCFQSLKKRLFSLQFWCFFELCWLKGSLVFMFYVFVLVCFSSCVVSFQFKEFICIILFLCCCVFVTRLSGLLICILWSFFLFCFLLLFCFEFCLFLFFSFLSKKKTPPKNRTRQKPKKAKMQKNRTKEKVSAIGFTNSVLSFFGVGLKFSFFAENTIKIVVSASFQTGKNTQKLAKMLSQNLVRGCVETWSKYVAQQNWTKF